MDESFITSAGSSWHCLDLHVLICMGRELYEKDLAQNGQVDNGDPGVNAADLQASDNKTIPPGCFTVIVLGLLEFCDVEFLRCT